MNFILIVILVVLFCILCYQILSNHYIGYGGGLEQSKDIFPHRKHFKSVEETFYSVAGPYQTNQEIKVFRSLFKHKQPKEIIDATAHVGVDSLTLAYSFPKAHVTSVERNPDVYKLLRENIEELGYSTHKNGHNRVTAVNMSADIYLENLNQNVDLIYMDPPWGGRGYVAASDLPLHDESGNPSIPLSKVVNLALKKTELLVLKAPYNFKVNEFGEKINGKIESVRNINRLNDSSRASFIFMIIKRV
jgi:16S rRNA G966 N2-methylase RsmD